MLSINFGWDWIPPFGIDANFSWQMAPLRPPLFTFSCCFSCRCHFAADWRKGKGHRRDEAVQFANECCRVNARRCVREILNVRDWSAQNSKQTYICHVVFRSFDRPPSQRRRGSADRWCSAVIVDVFFCQSRTVSRSILSLCSVSSRGLVCVLLLLLLRTLDRNYERINLVVCDWFFLLLDFFFQFFFPLFLLSFAPLWTFVLGGYSTCVWILSLSLVS